MASSQDDSPDSYERVVPETVDEDDDLEAEESLPGLVAGGAEVPLRQDFPCR
jgi:hypothetical protein